MSQQTSNINDFHTSSEAAVAQAAASRGLLGLELVMDDAKTLGAQIKTMASAGTTEAQSERHSLIMQAVSSGVQALGQIASGVAVAGSSLYSMKSSAINGLRNEQSGLQSNLEELEGQQTKMRTVDPAAPAVNAAGEAANLDPAVQERIQQMRDGNFKPAAKPVSADSNLDVDAEAFAHLKATDPAEYSSVKDDLSNQVSDLNKQINTIEQQITGKTTLANNMGNIVKEGASALTATGQAVTQGLQSAYVCNKILNQNVLSLLQASQQVLTKIIDAASQNVDASQSATVQASQLLASAA